MTDEDRYGGYTPGRATRFYIPLLLQAFSQSLTYPLVASIVAHGEYGVKTLTAFAQGQTVMFMIGALGGGLVMTGMVFGKTLSGYRSFIRLNTWMMTVLLTVQMFLTLPPFDALIFQRLLNLPPELAAIASQTMRWGVVMQAAFFLRNVPLVVLFNNRASFEANIATMIRILLTVASPYLFIKLGWTGAMWGLAATTGPCIVEYVLSHLFARKYVKKLKSEDSRAAEGDDGALRQFNFTLPLSLGGFLLASSPFLVAAFVGRATEGVAMLAIHYVTIGLANPVSYGAFRMQAVAIQFPPEYRGDWRLVRYAACAGAILGIIPLFVALPRVGDWYFQVVQNLPQEHVHLARVLMCCYAVWPIFQCVRGHAEGYAAWCKHPTAVLCGQLAHISVLVIVLATALHFGMPGWQMGVTGILVATLATIFAVHAAVHLFQVLGQSTPLSRS